MNQNERMLPGDPQKKTYMSDQEFTAHMEELISTPNAEANHNLLDLANSLWFELKEDLYHTFSFISRHFSPEVLQNVYDLCGDPKNGFLPWELLGAAIYLQTGRPRRKPGRTSGMRSGKNSRSCPHRRALTRSAPWGAVRCGSMERKRDSTPSTSGSSIPWSC